MSVMQAIQMRVRDLGPVFLVAVAVAFASTLAGAVLDRVHQVNAEDIGSREFAAAPGPDATQVLTLPQWGVRLTLPLVHELPTVSYAPQSAASVGLTSSDLEALGPGCRAARNALGALVRVPAGSYDASTKGDGAYTYIATIAGYDYAYLAPQGDCTGVPGAGFYINREQSIVLGALGSLSAQ